MTNEHEVQAEADEVARMAALQVYLGRHDEPCPRCGYKLRGLRGVNCPECGLTLRLCLKATRVPRGQWVAGLIGLAAVLGFNLLFFVFILAQPGYRWSSIRWVGMASSVGLPALLAGIGIVLHLRLTPRWTCLPAWKRRLVVAACWCLPLVDAGWFAFNMRA